MVRWPWESKEEEATEDLEEEQEETNELLENIKDSSGSSGESEEDKGYSPGERFKKGAKISGKKFKGHATKFKTIFLVIVVPAIIIVVGWLLMSMGAIPNFGIAQALSGKGGETEFFLSGIADSHAIRSFKHKLMNPFQIQPETAQVEKAPEEKEKRGSPLQSFSISARVPTKRVEYGQPSGSIEVTAKNEGTATIGKLEIKVEGQRKKDRDCVKFKDSSICEEVSEDDKKWGDYCKITYSNLKPGTLRKAVISNVKVSAGKCGEKAKEKQTMQYNIKVKGKTWYYTGSRLAIETINTDYATLLIKNEVLKLEKRSAIAMRGTAVRINLDAGRQPLFDTTDSTSVIINWENLGSGKVIGRPILYLLSPSSKNRTSSVNGSCNVWESGMNVSVDFGSGGIDHECNDALKSEYFCNITAMENHFEGIDKLRGIKGSPIETLKWLCKDQLSDRCMDNQKCHLCAGALNMSQFEAFSCNLDVEDVTSSERRRTSYLTAFAFYKYKQRDLVSINAYHM